MRLKRKIESGELNRMVSNVDSKLKKIEEIEVLRRNEKNPSLKSYYTREYNKIGKQILEYYGLDIWL